MCAFDAPMQDTSSPLCLNQASRNRNINEGMLQCVNIYTEEWHHNFLCSFIALLSFLALHHHHRLDQM